MAVELLGAGAMQVARLLRLECSRGGLAGGFLLGNGDMHANSMAISVTVRWGRQMRNR